MDITVRQYRGSGEAETACPEAGNRCSSNVSHLPGAAGAGFKVEPEQYIERIGGVIVKGLKKWLVSNQRAE